MSGITLEDAKEMVGPGWGGLIEKIYSKLNPDTYVMQVKEKFGGLRFYVGAASPEELEVIMSAEHESYHICEQCGEVGECREDLSWILTLCDKHYKEQKGE